MRRAEEHRLAAEAAEAAEVARREANVQQREAEAARRTEESRRAMEALELGMQEEQARLAQEQARQAQLKKTREAAPQVVATADFSYEFEAGMPAKIKAFRQRGTGGDTLIIRIDHERNMLLLEQSIKGVANLETLAELLEDESEPRYVLYIHKVAHRDGRVQYPIAFIVWMPEGIPVHLKVMYTRPVVVLVENFQVNKHITLDDPEDLTDEWLEKQLGIEKK